MKILKLLNRKYLKIITIFLIINFPSYSEDKPVDIWNINNLETKEVIEKELSKTKKDENKINASDIFNMQSQNSQTISINQSLTSKDIKIIGLYDPEDYGLRIDMWINSDGDQLRIYSQIYQN